MACECDACTTPSAQPGRKVPRKRACPEPRQPTPSQRPAPPQPAHAHHSPARMTEESLKLSFKRRFGEIALLSGGPHAALAGFRDAGAMLALGRQHGGQSLAPVHLRHLACLHRSEFVPDFHVTIRALQLL